MHAAMPTPIDPDLVSPDPFSPDAIAPETAALNARLIDAFTRLPDRWAHPVALVREARAAGRGPIPPLPVSPRARTIVLDERPARGRPGALTARLIAPSRPRGIYFHIHGGGWTFGTNAEQDPWLERLADRLDLACVSVAYRLAPEHPYPAAPDDCEDAALALVARAGELLGLAGPLFIGGESAGAHLALTTLLRLRDRHGLMPFVAANLFCGCYDLALTPSVRRWGRTPLVLDTRDIAKFAQNYLGGHDPREPDVSPIHADLAGLPPILVSCGTKDPLLDDTLFLAARLCAARVPHEVALWPGGCHVFHRFDIPMAEDALARIDGFLGARLPA